MRQKKTAPQPDGNGWSGSNGFINNTTASVAPHELLRKHTASDVAVVTATDPTDRGYRAVLSLMLLALTAATLTESGVA